MVVVAAEQAVLPEMQKAAAAVLFALYGEPAFFGRTMYLKHEI